MAKTNFTKVEEALAEGLMRMSVVDLLDMAACASKTGTLQTPASANAAGPADTKQLLATLAFELKYCKDEKIFAAGEISKAALKNLLAKPDALSPEEWHKLKEFQQKVAAYKKQQASQLPQDEDEKLIAAQRKKHINKRYNTKEQWLPLQ